MGYYKCIQVPLIEKTASGAVASFSDGIGGIPFSDLTAQIVAVQSGSGDPSPSNVRPISGYTGVNVTRTGKNFFDPSTVFSEVGSYLCAMNITPNAVCNISFTDKDTSVSLSGIYFGFVNSNYSGGTLPSDGYRWCIENGVVQTTKINTRQGIILTGLVAYPKNQTTIDTILARYNIQIEIGESATEYVPFIAKNDYSVTWQTEAGTVYGGSIDLTTGVLTVTHGIVDLGDLTWFKSTTNAVFYCNMGGVNTEYNALCEIYKYAGTVTGATGAYSNGNNTLSILTNDSRHLVYVRDDSGYSDATEFTNAVRGYYFVYELATPQTYQLTATEIISLLGTNNVFSDTGDTSVTYKTKP